mgnify:CR=1 FL=1
MDYQALFNELHLFEQLLALLVGMPRLFMLVQVAPFMGGNILTGQLRTTVVFACYLILHPAIVASLPETQGLSPSTFALYGAILVKETLIGMLLGYLSGMLFWTIQCAGFFIDNQRGASMAEGADPLSGEQTSPLGSFFFQSAVYLFFSTGAFLALLGVVYASYEIWPVTQLIPLSVFKDIHLPLFFAGRVSWLLLMMLLLSGPIVVACLLTDVSLGLINRFASHIRTVKGGTIEPHVNNNWKIVGNNWKAADHQKAVQLLREGKLALNENADARTLPGKAITTAEIAKF